jgi:voltage-gated potassium channel
MHRAKDKLKQIGDVIDSLRKEKVPRLMISLLAVVTLFGTAMYVFERNTPDALIKSVGDGIWWGFVTISTTGYGDKYPVTWAGRVVAIFTMLTGMFLTIVISGTIASILVERKLKEGRGLQKINIKDHILICGWNESVDSLLDGFRIRAEKSRQKTDIVLVSELETEAMSEIQFTYATKFLGIEFIRGNFTHEQVLEKANVKDAKSVVLLADESGENTRNNADERVVLAAYTVSTLNPAARISVEIQNPQNEQYLKRTNVDSIIVTGEFNSFMLINAALNPGVPQALKEIMNFSMGKEITTRNIPSNLVGKKFEDLSRFIREKEGAILIGIISESKKLSIDDFLQGDPSSIDEFIKRKFAESEKDFFSDTGGQLSVMVNPGWDYVIKDDDRALMIGEARTKA